MRQLSACAVVLLLLAAPGFAQDAPVADYHQQLYSPAIAALISPPPPAAPITPIDAADLVALLDAAHIRKALVLSVAYIYGQPTRHVEHEYENVLPYLR